jgi:hypothetical protein
VTALLRANASGASTVLDPFAGSGTTLFEASRLGFAVVGAEINKAAYWFSTIATFGSLGRPERIEVLGPVREFIEVSESNVPFMKDQVPDDMRKQVAKAYAGLSDEKQRSALACSVMLAMVKATTQSTPSNSRRLFGE